MITCLDDILFQLKDEIQKGIYFVNANTDEFHSYNDIYISALKMLHSLRLAGIRENNELVFQIDTPKKFIILFWACILGDIIPVPIAVGNHEGKSVKLKKVYEILNNPYVVFENEIYEAFSQRNDEWISANEGKILLVDQLGSVEESIQLSDLESIIQKSDEGRIAFVQFSSGSTGDPKGVTLTHKNLITNILSIIQGAELTSNDFILSWMPLTHDMGLIGNHLSAMASKINQCILPTQLFIRKPHIWLEKASHHRANILSSPNFGYRFYLDHVKEEKMESLDLSCVRLIFNGAEPISKEVVDEFLEKMSKYGLKSNSMFPVYGLAEASLAVAFPVPGSETQALSLNRYALKPGDKIEISDEKTNVNIVCVGSVLHNVNVKIVDNNGNQVQDEVIGTITIKGDNVTKSYYNDEKTTRKIISSTGWLNTGDLGFLKDNKLYITGRIKDIIFINGQNFYAHDLERIAEQVEGIALGKVVAFGKHNYELQQEEIIFFILYKNKDLKPFCTIAENLRRHMVQSVGININHIIPISKVPKTTSGKVQRFKLLENYEEGQYNSIIKQLNEIKSIYEKQEIELDQGLARENINSKLVNVLNEVLGYRITEFDRSLVELGVDSIKVVDVQKRLEDVFNIKIPVSVVFDYPTLNQLSDYIFSSLHKKGSLENKLEVQELKNSINNFDEQIAIIGMACRFPGNANSPEELWSNLMNSVDGVEKIPDTRWNKDEIGNEPNRISGVKVKNGGFIKGINLFDNQFFSIPPIEAIEMDPQQRVLLEVCWESLERAGINIKKLSGTRTSNVIGISGHDYTEQTLSNVGQINPYSFTGSMLSVASGRISYLLGLQGPTMSIDTACSSSLVAINQAILFLKDHQCDLALAGAVNLIISEKAYVGFSKLNALSPDGRCKAFDDSADGYGRSEGCAVVVLKRLSDAVRDNDNILSVIMGSAINHDGKSSGLTVPNGLAQEDVIKQAIKKAGISTDQVDYLETHGTGTKIGDPQEVNALANVFSDRNINNKLKIGTIKSNIGHTESAAGMAGIAKVVLSLQNRMIPANLHFNVPNKLIPWDDIPVEVVSKATPWEKDSGERIAGISSFGFSGTNAHVILKEAPKKETYADKGLVDRDYHILALSAKNSTALNDMKNRYIDYLGKTTQSIADICYTANISRTIYEKRLSVTGENIEELVRKLTEFDISNCPDNNGNTDSGKGKIVFVYSGQGSIYKNIGRELYVSSDIFKNAMDKCEKLFLKYIDKSLISVIYDNDQEENLRKDIYSLPIIFSIEYALTKLWKSWGITPSCVMGYGVGEYSAACEAGIFNLEDAVKIVATKGKLLSEVSEGRTVEAIESEDTVYDQKDIKGIRLNNPNIDMIWASDENDMKPDNIEYWLSHKKEPVNFSEMITKADKKGYTTYLEIGGTSVLSELESQELINSKERTFLPSLKETKSSWKQMFESLSELYNNGANVEWDAIDMGLYRNKVILPTYPFQRENFWKNDNIDNKKEIIHITKPIENESKEPSYSVGLLKELEDSPAYERKEILIKHMQKVSAQILGFKDYNKVSISIPLMEQGFDSIMSVDLRDEIFKLTQKQFPVTFLFNYPTIEKSAEYILEKVLNLSEPSSDKNDKSELKAEQINTETADSILDELEKLL